MDIDFTAGTFANVTATEPTLKELVKNMTGIKPRALASFPEVATAALLKPQWRKKPSTPLDDIRAAAEMIRNSPPAPKPSTPADAVPITDGVSLRPVKFEIERVQILRKGDIEQDFLGTWPMRQSEVRVHFITPDRDGGQPLKLFYRQKLNDELLEKEPAYLPAMIRDTIRLAYMHEVDEMLYFEGERFTEPHPENGYNGKPFLRAKAEEKQNTETVARIESRFRAPADKV